VTEPIIVNKPKKRRKFKGSRNLGLLLFTAITMTVIVWVAYLFFFPHPEEIIIDFYTYAEVGTMDFLDSLTVSGTITPETVIELKSKEKALVVQVFVREGNDVTAGDPLIQLYSQELEEAKSKALADLEKAQAALAQLQEDHAYELITHQNKVEKAEQDVAAKQVNYELYEKLYSFGAVAKVDLERTQRELQEAQQALKAAELELAKTLRTQQNALKQAQATLSQAEETLAAVEDKLAGLLLTAPISGRVLSLKAQPGKETAGEVLVTLADSTTQYAKLNISAAQAEKFTVGTPAEIAIGQNRYPAQVSYIAPQAQQTQEGSMVEVHLQIDGSVRLRPYSTVTASIHLGIYRDSLCLPRGLYLSSGQQLFVYVLEQDQAVRRDVQFGIIQGNYIQILNGLELGEKVITSSYDQFRHLERVQILPEGGRKL